METNIDWCRQNKELIVSLYGELKNVWKVSEHVPVSGGTIHAFLKEIKKIKTMNIFSEEEKDFLLTNYITHRDIGDLKSLAEKMKRSVPFICRKAKELGLTDPSVRIPMKLFSNNISESRKRYYETNEHPKGMLGKKHSEETKKQLSELSKKRWEDPDYILNSEEYRQKMSDRMSQMQANGKLMKNYSRAKSGTITIGGKTNFFRSSWESNIAAYFEMLKNNGQIKEWEYETDTFWFDKIKRGVRSYKPDFKITNNDGSQYFVEVKGWMDSKSKTKLNRMRIYHPSVKIELLDSKRYNEIKKYSTNIPNWGLLDNGIGEGFKKCSVEGCENKNHCKNLCRKHFHKAFGK